MRLLQQDHLNHHLHHQQEELQQQQQQQQQADQQELQRQRILSLFESSPPPQEAPEDHLPDLQAAPSSDPRVLPRPDEAPRAGGAAAVDVADGGSGVAVGVQARADVQVRKRRGRPPRLNGGGGAVTSSVAGAVGRREDGEEDVCFICFDGGTLVLCDRR